VLVLQISYVPERNLYPVPDGVTDEQAAQFAVGLSELTKISHMAETIMQSLYPPLSVARPDAETSTLL
jgi:hypothetical protein